MWSCGTWRRWLPSSRRARSGGRGRDLLAKAEALADAVERFKAGDGRIDIGTFQSMSNVILPSVARRLRDEHPGCEIRLSEVPPEDPQIGDLDLLFYDRPVDGEHVKPVDDPYLPVVRPGDFPDGPVPLKRLDGRLSASSLVSWGRSPAARVVAPAGPGLPEPPGGEVTVLEGCGADYVDRDQQVRAYAEVYDGCLGSRSTSGVQLV